MKNISKLVSHKIREFRLEKNMTIKDLAKKIGVSQQQLSRYERDVNKICINTLYDLSIALEHDISDFLPKKSHEKPDINNDVLKDTKTIILFPK